MKSIIILILISAFYIPLKAQDTTYSQKLAGDHIIGVWQTQDQKAQITISKQDSLYFGKLSNATLNIDKSIHINLPISLLGIYILRDLKFNGDNRWDGMIFDPKSQNTYKCYLRMNADGTMKVRGYKGISLFGKSQYWKRVK
ncbi:DUF2147 domain-containing protein [Mucilaginibacter pallidiroseus]|uniref:DUF2147 domain-containing protein n=1 Tax=Mucilaginibacter pallidiroseus TaxID=2599295 RepID=A0A563UEF7_9SPHI|nr:DUF2147 domain-containing protein [Mucilaginibacter pallidiroseus]TWR29649.1 DUF2147 domain-containing protein [Mucilaginibacter pallidiroseus]